MKKLFISVASAFLIASCSCTNNNESLEYYKNMVVQQNQLLERYERIYQEQSDLISRYEEYYISTEELIDSADIEDTLLETDTGARYLQDRFNLDTLFNKLEANPHAYHVIRVCED